MKHQHLLPKPVQEILGFWFGALLDRSVPISKERRALWFAGRAATDQMIRDRFATTLNFALKNACQDWLAVPLARLAYIVLLDQFSRHIHRGTPAAFAGDQHALAASLAGMERGVDLELNPVGRAFFYLPLEHAEDLSFQERSVAAFDNLRTLASESQKGYFESFYDYAIRHRDVIARFGRFPHRNRILGRDSTLEERDFLKQPGSSF
ncbi:MAG: DUF924 domain-containing protein [Deltaproteobacteria bacterium]|jgi:uncharacterized protein (DUF924 family)|nr:DUF924 domain-containing protein [Deltaproteobacteria bacterium]